MPNPREVATLQVRGDFFEDWTSVWVQQRMTEEAALFRFTAVERDPVPDLWTKLQFRPGQECAIYLGQQLAVAGIITTRQTAYDANQHGVMLLGKGMTWYAARGSILDKTGNYDGMTFEQVARKIIKPFGIEVKPIGKLDATPFEILRLDQGKNVWDFLEGLARPRNIILGSDHEGNFLLIGKHSHSDISPSHIETLIEGVNILKMQCTLTVEHVRSDLVVRAQSPASDDNRGTAASELEASVKGTAARYSPLLTMAEQPVRTQAEVQKRAQAEAQWTEGTFKTANVTVQGWHKSSGILWRAGEHVMVKSPMAILNEELKAQSVTFTQDSNSGTLTVLDLVPTWYLNGNPDLGIGPGGVQDPKDPNANPSPGPAIQSTPPSDIPPSTIPPPSTGRLTLPE